MAKSRYQMEKIISVSKTLLKILKRLWRSCTTGLTSTFLSQRSVSLLPSGPPSGFLFIFYVMCWYNSIHIYQFINAFMISHQCIHDISPMLHIHPLNAIRGLKNSPLRPDGEERKQLPVLCSICIWHIFARFKFKFDLNVQSIFDTYLQDITNCLLMIWDDILKIEYKSKAWPLWWPQPCRKRGNIICLAELAKSSD